MSKVEFDGKNKLIKLNDQQTMIDVFSDIYDPWKIWSRGNLNFSEAIRSVGGNPTDHTSKFCLGWYLLNGQRISVIPGDYTIDFFSNIWSNDKSYPIFGRDWTTDNTLPVINLHYTLNEKVVFVKKEVTSYAPVTKQVPVSVPYGAGFPRQNDVFNHMKNISETPIIKFVKIIVE